MSRYSDQYQAIADLLESPDRDFISGRSYAECELICSLSNLGIISINLNAGTYRLASAENAQRFINRF